MTSPSDELEAYFTDVEELRDYFQRAVGAPALPRRLLFIHGVGGIGKSSLLRMFRLHCKNAHTPVGLVSGDEARSAAEVLSAWADDLRADKIVLASFAKTLRDHRTIQAKVEDQARKAQETRGKAVQSVGKAAAKTAVEIAVGYIPVVGPIISALGSTSAEALVDWLGGFLTKPEIDILLDPSKKLADDFLSDIGRVAGKQRLALMLDTFEQMTALDDWVRDFAQRLHPNVILVVAGRIMPNWNRRWPGWLALAQVEELKPMTRRAMHELIRRYYATQRGGEPDPGQVDAIIRFARGLPLVVTTAVQMWAQYGVEDFQTVKPQVLADLADRLTEGIPAISRPVLEAAATLRWFNQDILQAITQTKVGDVYDELRRFPFVRPRAQGLALHDTVREILDANLHAQAPDRYRELHQRAALYFEERLQQATDKAAELFDLEHLYHSIRADQQTGIKIFQTKAEELTRYQFASQLRVLLNDVNSHVFETENGRLWHEYYLTRLAVSDVRLKDEADEAYRRIAESERAEPRLRGYALSDRGGLWRRSRFIMRTGGLQQLEAIIEESDNLLPATDPRRIDNRINLARAYSNIGDKAVVLEQFSRAVALAKEQGDQYSLARVYGMMIKVYAMYGNWRMMMEAQRSGLAALPTATKTSVVYGDLLGSWALGWSWAGRYSEAEQNVRQQLAIKKRLGHTYYSGPLRDLGFSLGLQARYGEAVEALKEALENYQSLFHKDDASTLCLWACVLIRQQKLDVAETYLKRSLELRQSHSIRYMPENLVWLGHIYELCSDWYRAEDFYHQCLSHGSTNRHYFECGALVGLSRVKHTQSDFVAILHLLAEAEQLAQQYEYNDHLASLRLTQGHTAWNGEVPEWGQGFDAALRYYQQALVYALRYNRFMLDEVLWGGGICTPLRPIIPHCSERGEEGRRMLTALRDWWQTGVNDVGMPRPDAISPISEGLPLSEAERLARQHEPGEGSPQQMVIEKLTAALTDH